ncbi:hypothetical protein OPT61_g614 [Boeremia exigua]|uniref:Uncharacterized protein n=1 Tax=Boeremia exigua TaxID=749465 RepID=A0ACC2ITB0_9PLEO|nr:hypothetical protein OPT61_g614 [Boeremia exigua]
MTARWHVGPACMRRLITTVEGKNPISRLLSPSGLEFAGERSEFVNEALEDCRLCRILKDFLDQIEEEARVRRNRLQHSNESPQGLHTDQHVRFVFHLSQNRFSISAPNVIFSGTLQFSPTTSPGDPVAHFLPGTVAKLNRGGPATFRNIRLWIHECDRDHSECTGSEATLPVRLVDLLHFSQDDRRLRLYITRPGERNRYAALSYCWGYSQPVITTNRNLFQHLRKIQYKRLPQTLQDAVHTAKAIGLRFLWIDALCIIQDSESDKRAEIAKMAQIYQNAYLTIVAACTTSSAEGFLQVRNGTPPALEIPVGCHSGRIGTLSLLPTYRTPRYEALHDRAWTLQEIILSPRLLIFGRDAVGWKCTTADDGLYRWTDWNGYCASTGLTTIRIGSNGTVTRPRLSFYSPERRTYRSSQQAERLPHMFRIWKELVKDYSTRSMTNDGDKLNAIAGTMTYFQKHMNDDYLAGLWRNHLMKELSWKIRGAKRPATKRAPSWSWMALDGPVCFHRSGRAERAPFSNVTGGTLVLSGWFGSIPKLTRISRSVGLRQCDIEMGGLGAIVLDCELPGMSDCQYFGLATCVMATADGNDDGFRWVWGLVLREIVNSDAGRLLYERVGWFSCFTWKALQSSPSDVTIV